MKLDPKKTLIFLLFLITQLGFSQLRVIKGQVTDPAGLPLPGVSIAIKNTNTTTQTDFDGKYSIKATAEQTIVYSFIGMLTKEAKASNETMNIQLFQSATELDQLVITAFGVKKSEKSLGYAVSKIESDEIRKSGEQNIIQALAGKAAGVQVIGSGGTPGASSKIIIRGTNTITRKTDPLIVIDGIPINNETAQLTGADNPFNENLDGVNNSNRALDINPEDIESVSILKGAAAAALYGERAGNGVILYTTKKGKKDQGIGIDFSTSLAIDRVNKLPAKQTIYVQGKNNTALDTSTAQSWGPTAASLNLNTYNNEDAFFKDGITNTNNLALYGGTDKITYRVSYGNLNQTGMIPQTDLNRNTIRMVTDIKLTTKLKAGASLQYTTTSNTLAQNGSNVSGVMLSLLRSPIQYNILDYKDAEGNNTNYFSAYDNPLFTVNENPATSQLNRVIGNFNLSYLAEKWLNLTMKVGFDSYSDNKKQIFAISSNGGDLGGIGGVNFYNINAKELYSDFIATGAIPTKTDWIKINYTAGLNLRTYQNSSLFSRGRNLAVRGLYNLANATELYTSNEDEKNISRALFGQLEFDIKNQLFISATTRKEWSSTYGANVKSAIFPSISGSWVFTSSFNLPSWINFGKVTYAHGEVGIAPSAYKTTSTYSQPFITDGFTNGLSFPYNNFNGMSLTGTLGNTDLKPERVIENEIGISTKLFNNRLSLDLNYYVRNSKDLLINVPLATSTGFSSEYKNAAEIENKGIELEIGYKIFNTKNAFQWDINLNWSQNKNEVTQIYGDLKEFEIEEGFDSPRYFAIKGKPAGSFYGSKWERNEAGALIIGSDGLPLIQKNNGYIGNYAPNWMGSIRNTFSWKNITLSSLIEVRRGGDIANKTLARLNRFGISEASADRNRMYIITGVTEDGKPNNIEITPQDYYSYYVGDGGAADEQFIETVNWVRLRDVTLSYDFKKTMFKFIHSAQISLTGRNLWLLTNYKGVDPETSLTGAGSRINGLDYFNNPGSKSIIMNLRLTF